MKDNSCKCKRCKDVFDSNDLKEFRQMKEQFSVEPFLCPDCYDEFLRLDTQDQLNALVEDKFDW